MGITLATRTKTYDPWAHAEQLGARVIVRDDLPDEHMVGAYHPGFDCIYLRPGLSHTLERCTLAHELVHWEHGDDGCHAKHDARAKRISAERLIDPEQLHNAMADTLDLERIARELSVTIGVLTHYMASVGVIDVRTAEKYATKYTDRERLAS